MNARRLRTSVDDELCDAVEESPAFVRWEIFMIVLRHRCKYLDGEAIRLWHAHGNKFHVTP